jgi:hypothetical protein
MTLSWTKWRATLWKSCGRVADELHEVRHCTFQWMSSLASASRTVSLSAQRPPRAARWRPDAATARAASGTATQPAVENNPHHRWCTISTTMMRPLKQYVAQRFVYRSRTRLTTLNPWIYTTQCFF